MPQDCGALPLIGQEPRLKLQWHEEWITNNEFKLNLAANDRDRFVTWHENGYEGSRGNKVHLSLSEKKKKEWLVNEINFEMEMGEINKDQAWWTLISWKYN